MNQPYLYDHTANVLRQRAEMEKPIFTADEFPFGTPMYDDTVIMWEHYNDYLASLPAYTPVSGWVPEVGKEYVEGKDFDILYDITEWDSDHANRSEFKRSNMFVKEHCVFDFMRDSPNEKDWHCVINEKVAIPIEQNQELTEKDFDDLTDLAKKERGPVFSLQDMIECWEAGSLYGVESVLNGGEKSIKTPDSSQYFRTKFNIDLP